MTLAPAARKLVLTLHVVASGGWIGAVVAYLALAIAAQSAPDALTVRGAWIAMELTGWAAIVPLAIASLLSGLLISLGTPWGLFRHYWVVVSLLLTVLATIILLLRMPTVSALATFARQSSNTDLGRLPGDLLHPGVGLLVLLAVAVLNVCKPRGMTPYGWRVQQEEMRGPIPQP